MAKEFKFRQGMFSGNAGPVYRELEKIRANHNGQLLAEDVLNAARNPRSPLYKYFQWNDQKAAHQYRMWTARSLIRSIIIIENKKPAKQVYINIKINPTSTTDSTGQYYQNIEIAGHDGFNSALEQFYKKVSQLMNSIEQIKQYAVSKEQKEQAEQIINRATEFKKKIFKN
jgi:hypothetical protein